MALFALSCFCCCPDGQNFGYRQCWHGSDQSNVAAGAIMISRFSNVISKVKRGRETTMIPRTWLHARRQDSLRPSNVVDTPLHVSLNFVYVICVVQVYKYSHAWKRFGRWPATNINIVSRTTTRRSSSPYISFIMVRLSEGRERRRAVDDSKHDSLLAVAVETVRLTCRARAIAPLFELIFRTRDNKIRFGDRV